MVVVSVARFLVTVTTAVACISCVTEETKKVICHCGRRFSGCLGLDACGRRHSIGCLMGLFDVVRVVAGVVTDAVFDT